MSRSYEFVQLDVFTRKPLTGNPLAIFTDASGLTDQQMQALAREMNLSETTFILPREPEVEAQQGKRVRILRSRKSCHLPDTRRLARRCTCTIPELHARMRSFLI